LPEEKDAAAVRSALLFGKGPPGDGAEPPLRQFPSAPRPTGNPVAGHGYGTAADASQVLRPRAPMCLMKVISSLWKKHF
jgi:hypothetical protein